MPSARTAARTTRRASAASSRATSAIGHGGAHGRHASDAMQRRDGHDAGQDRLLDAEFGELFTSCDPLVRLEEELRHGEVGRLELSSEVPAVLGSARRAGMALRVGADADAELPHFARELHELDRVAKLRRCARSSSSGRSPPSAMTFTHARVGVVLQEVAHLVATVPHADEVRHRREFARRVGSASRDRRCAAATRDLLDTSPRRTRARAAAQSLERSLRARRSPRRTWEERTRRIASVRAASSSSTRSELVGTTEIVFDSLDVVFAEVRAVLHFDEDDGRRAAVLAAVQLADRDVDARARRAPRARRRRG